MPRLAARNRLHKESKKLGGVDSGRFLVGEVMDRISIKNNGRILLARFDEIDWIGAAANYAEFHVGQSTHLLLSTLNTLEARLLAARFVRISRFTIVNACRVKELRLDRHGRCTVVLLDGTELVVSATHRRKLDQLLDNEQESLANRRDVACFTSPGNMRISPRRSREPSHNCRPWKQIRLGSH